MFKKKGSILFNKKIQKYLLNFLQELFLKIIRQVQHPFPMLLAEPTFSIKSALVTLFL